MLPYLSDLLVAHLSFNGVPTVSGFTGFTPICRQTNSNVTGEIWYRIANGSETNGTYTTSASENSITRIYRIATGQWHGTTPPECATSSGLSTTINPPNLTPSWAGAENLRYYAFASRFRGDSVINGYPTNYVDDQFVDNTGTASTSVQMGAASRALNSASDDPDGFAVPGSQNWAAFTVALRAFVGGGGGGGEPAATWEQRDYCWKYWQDAESATCSFAQNTQAYSHPHPKLARVTDQGKQDHAAGTATVS